MLISEIFLSIQGEGRLTGVPSVFIRTSRCNLRCHWCDTKYASWDPQGEDRSLEQILDAVDSFPASHCVITGGEPMMAQGMPELASALKDRGKHITVETSATIPPNGITCDLASLSPKLSNATPEKGQIDDAWIQRHEARRLRPRVIDAWLAHYDYQLKFVVAEARDVSEIESLLASLEFTVPPHRVLLMPEGLSPETIRGRDQTLVELCMRHGYRYCNRLHLELFGNTPAT